MRSRNLAELVAELRREAEARSTPAGLVAALLDRPPPPPPRGNLARLLERQR